MAKEKFDFEKYANWCEKNGVEGDNPESLVKYKAYEEKVAETGEKAGKIAKQKEVFDSIVKYCGRKVKYDETYYEAVQEVLESICFAMEMCQLNDKVGKVLNDYGMGGKEND